MKKLVIILSIIFTMCENVNAQDVIKTCTIKYQNCQLFREPNSEVITKIGRGRSVDVIDVIDGYFKVIYKGEVGYILDTFIFDTELNAIKEKVKQDKLAMENERIYNEKIKREEEKKQRLNSLTDKYGELHARIILAGKVILGMTAEEVRESWGAPDDINRTSNVYKTSEQWVYQGDNYKNSYLYFEDGILETIQD